MWVDRQRNLVIYDTPQHLERVCGTVPGAKALGANGYVAFPRTLYNLQLAKWIGLPVPEAMEHYDWPGRYKPFHAQRTTANFLAVTPRACVLSDMGTGKTLAALWAADFLMAQSPGMKALVVAPLSTLQRVWADALFQNFLGRRKHVVVHGDAAKRRKLLAQDVDFYIINFDGVDVLKEDLAQRADIRMVIIDEASAYRSHTTKRHRLARKLLAPRDYVWLMTGTPTPNGPTDAYGLAKLVSNAGGESYVSYHNRVMTQVSRWKWVPKAGSHRDAHRLMQPSIRFSIDDCVDLPPCVTQQREVGLSAEQAKAYKDLKRDCVLQLKQGQISAVNEAVLRLKLIQISCGAVYDAGHNVHFLDSTPRLSVLREVIEECREKIIIFAPLTSVLTLLYKELSKEHTCAVINGEVPVSSRNDTFRDFQEAAAPRILIADPGTMSHGLTLVAATTIVWYAPTDRTELYLQANARINRPGQTKSTAVVQLASTPIEREIYRRLESNQNLQGLILQLAKE